MAKKEMQDGRGRLRVFFAEFEGNDGTIQDGLKAIAGAVNRTFEPKVQVIKYIKGGESDPDDPAASVGGLTPEFENVEDALEPSPENGGKRRPRKSPGMSIVKDLNLMPPGKRSLRDFWEEKKPKSQYSEITVSLYYLQKILELQGITPNHIYTCYKDVSVRSPKDLPQSIRNTASNKGWVDSSDQKNLTVTNHGENHVEHDLPGSEE